MDEVQLKKFMEAFTASQAAMVKTLVEQLRIEPDKDNLAKADVAHGYHTMLNLGVRPDRIITMMFDDVALSKENPRPGVLINSPNGPDVYKGVIVDYKGWDVTPENFLKVLSGNKTAMKGIGSGRVIESDSNSTVFVYFVDHGGPGVLFFPDYVPLGADDLHNTLANMYRKKQYKNMILFIEACFVGSLFEEIIEEHTNILVFSATARDEGSWPWYCDGVNVTSCKGDEFSIKLWEYMDSVNPGEYKTLNEMYQRVRTGISHSHLNLYGDLSLGAFSFIPNKLGKKQVKTGSRTLETTQQKSVKPTDTQIFYLEQTIAQSKNLQTRLNAQKELDNLLSGRTRFDEMMAHLVTVATADAPQLREKVNNVHLPLNLDIFPCYRELYESFRKYCFSIQDDYVLSQMYKLANICVLHINTAKLLREMPRICKPYGQLGSTTAS
uniref:Legumain n=1 Tax=Lygus hesperus TaxID=30085 RepID=A0A0A9W8J2_LYGHE